MPTYDYQCGKCGFEFEREQRITEDAIKTCPKCKSRQAKRLLSAPSFILRGGGWYADGYGSSSNAKGGSDSSDSAPTGDTETAPTSSKQESTSDDSGSGKGGEKSAGKKSSGKKSKKSAA